LQGRREDLQFGVAVDHQFDVGRQRRNDALPKLFAAVAAGRLHLRVQPKSLAEVERVWNAGEPSGTRVVLTP
jgi:hypothetical protein